MLVFRFKVTHSLRADRFGSMSCSYLGLLHSRGHLPRTNLCCCAVVYCNAIRLLARRVLTLLSSDQSTYAALQQAFVGRCLLHGSRSTATCWYDTCTFVVPPNLDQSTSQHLLRRDACSWLLLGVRRVRGARICLPLRAKIDGCDVL